jgi:hypothetical protein
MVLLSNHIFMTFGSVKGARIGTELIKAHLEARSIPERLAVIASRVLSGGQLSSEQRREFIALAEERVGERQRIYDALKARIEGLPGPPQAPGTRRPLSDFER